VGLGELGALSLLGVDFVEDDLLEDLLDFGVFFRLTGEDFAGASPLGVEVDEQGLVLFRGGGTGFLEGSVGRGGASRPAGEGEDRHPGGEDQARSHASFVLSQWFASALPASTISKVAGADRGVDPASITYWNPGHHACG
jgi:hypothetical protein